MKNLTQLPAYNLIDKRNISEFQATGTVLEHKKTGARIFLISNDDENKVFYVGFRTPPSDDTGVPHILEHSVLCGSDKFPVKDPFVELVKGSLNTFLNAMTYPDKTVYPIASCNNKDFQNLMDVYMDAVFHPNIYNEKKIFMQEGWHYELESEEAPVIYNGVVYNEMKGAFSSPESVLDRYTQKMLFPDTCYGYESGGDPKHVPELTYEAFLDFHRTYYHPSNSFIYLYGDMDMAEKLEWLDEAYLSHYDKKEVDSRIQMQKPFTRRKDARITYSITEDEPEEDATYLAVSNVVNSGLDPQLNLAFSILDYTLLGAPGAPLKQALLDAGIGHDILGGYDGGILQPYFSVVAKDANEDQKGEFLAVVTGTLRKLAEDGINKKSLLAGLNYYEFRSREADYGTAPKGLMYGLQALDSWLYDGNPMMHLEYIKIFDALKKAVNDGYFEQLIKDYLLDNPFGAVIVVSPERNLTAKEDSELAAKLADYKSKLSDQEVEFLVEETQALKLYQDTPSLSSELEKIPMLSRDDIDHKAEELHWKELMMNGVQVLHHDMFTSGIGYLKVLFNTDRVPVGDLPYVGLLKSVLGYVDTEHFSYSDLTSEIHLNSGGISFSTSSYVDLGEESPRLHTQTWKGEESPRLHTQTWKGEESPRLHTQTWKGEESPRLHTQTWKGEESPRLHTQTNGFTGAFVADVRVMYDKIGFGFDILAEILTRSKLDDEKRLGEILRENKSRSRMKLEHASHSAAVARATSYFSATASFNDRTGGIGFYHFLEDVVKDYEENSRALIEKLKEVAAKLFTVDNMLVNYTSNGEGFAYLDEAMKKLTGVLPEGSGRIYPCLFQAGNRNEGFKTASQVNYVARCGNFKKAGFSYTGALRILKVILSYDYLWLNLRVKGGAYGCMSGFGMSGEGYFVSYRDPNLAETDNVYEGIVDYLEKFQVDERDMTKYVIGTISGMDTPLNPSDKGARGLSAYLSHVSNEMLQKERDEVLGAQPENIRELAGIVAAVLKTGSFCTIGNEEKIEADKVLFGEIKNLYHG